MTATSTSYTLGIVGGRGFVGQELLTLLAQHPSIKVSWISSRQLQGQLSTSLVPQLPPFEIEQLEPQQVADKATDIVILALPNGLAEPYVQALKSSLATKVILDLSADYRSNPDWCYSLPELDTLAEVSPLKISNPGCYATAMQLALAPIKGLIAGHAHCFGVSGFSGAGTTPNAKNDPQNLKANLLPYALVEHQHESEVSERLQLPIAFTPHVAAFFRGINMTVQVIFEQPQSAQALHHLYQDFYATHPLVIISEAIPTIQQVVNTPNCLIGGFAVSADGKRATLVSCLDNLLKGAASQALQNINLALGLDSTTGLFGK